MKTLIWGGAFVLAAIWSLMCWAAHALIGYGGNLASRNADVVPYLPPEIVELASWLAIAGTNVGEWLVVAVWLVGMAMLLGLAAIGGRLLRSGAAENLRGRINP